MDYLFGKKEEPPLTCKERLKLFMAAHWRGVLTVIAPIIFIFILSPFPPQKYQWCAYCLVLMAVFWVFECIPLPVTSFLPILIFPMSEVMDTNRTCLCYINDSVLMFVGSLFLAYAVEQSGLHKRIALCAIRIIGYSHRRLLFAMSFTTMFVSMWITNTAATTMMVPINFALLNTFEKLKVMKIYEVNANGDKFASDITTCYFCTATYSATIGGIGTLVGTATNLVFKGLFQTAYPKAPEYLSFPKFSAFAVPYMIVMNIFLYLCMMILYFGLFRPNSKAAKNSRISPDGIKAAKEIVEADFKKLGKLSFWEIAVIILFTTAMLLFFCRAPEIFKGWSDHMVEIFDITEPKFIKDSAVASGITFLMMILPSSLAIFKHCTAKFHEDLPKNTVPTVLNWRLMNVDMPYSFMFLLGGGFALSTAARKENSDLNGKIGQVLAKLSGLPNGLILLLVIIISVFITNFASNVAVCNVITPLAMQLASEVKQNPLWYCVASGFSCSYAFMLPVGTPGNLIVQSAASIPTNKMIVAGFGPTVTTILISWVFMYLWAPVIWPDLNSLPGWISE